MIKGAEFSECRTWRYALWRIWDESKGCVMFIGLNPSTANENDDDPTVRRCINFARDWGYGGIYMMNIFAFRATDPRVMRLAVDPIGPENDHYLYIYHEASDISIASWGNNGVYLKRGEFVANSLAHLHCFGLTKGGHPKHPLYLKTDLKPIILGENK